MCRISAHHLPSKPFGYLGGVPPAPTLAISDTVVTRVTPVSRVSIVSSEVARMSKNSVEGGELRVLSFWIPKAKAVEVLGVSDRTLQRMVNRGQVERRMKGRTALYRILDRVATVDTTPDTIDMRHDRQGGELQEDTRQDRHDDRQGHVLEELVDRVTTLAVEKGEAIAIGHRLADARDEMARQLSVQLLLNQKVTLRYMVLLKL